MEIPPTPVRLGGLRLPNAGGESLRLLPFAMTRRAVSARASERTAAVLHLRTWETDVDQPLSRPSLLGRFRHATRLRVTLPCLERLLTEFPFTSVARRFPWYRAPHHVSGSGI